MEVCSGQNHDNKIAPQVNLNPTAANIMDLLCIFVFTKLNNTFFSVLVIIVATWIIFVIIIRICFHSYHELFFSGTLNYFSNVYRSRIIFSLGGELFFAVSRIIILGNSIGKFDWFILWHYWLSHVSSVGQAHSSSNIKNIMLEIRNYCHRKGTEAIPRQSQARNVL